MPMKRSPAKSYTLTFGSGGSLFASFAMVETLWPPKPRLHCLCGGGNPFGIALEASGPGGPDRRRVGAALMLWVIVSLAFFAVNAALLVFALVKGQPAPKFLRLTAGRSEGCLHPPDAPPCMCGSRLPIATRPWRISYGHSKRPLDGPGGALWRRSRS
jgi:hypothetical protein